MTKHVNTGGPAFPKLRSLNNCKPGEKIATYTSDGMTMRDYFAAKALESGEAGKWKDNQYKPQDGKTIIENIALHAYQIADAMLRAREGVK